jgi:hypothetical protein
MSSTTASTDEVRPSVRRASLWFGLVGGGLAWMLHLLGAYAIAEFGCVGRLGELSDRGISTVAWLEFVLTVVTVAIAGAATVVAYRRHRELRSKESSSGASIADAFTARAGVLASGILTFVILFESIPIFYYLRSC